ncbi:MAG: methionine aminopeptidase [Dermatophilaceae bacterium]|nr:methionine aminopeptidase [Intrasporangiaceae bacterium]
MTGEEADVQYWYNIRKGCVESDENRSQNDDVMGPYDTPDEAEAALATARAKTERWDDEDREWEDWGSTSRGSEDEGED